jgi:hypothetical protein
MELSASPPSPNKFNENIGLVFAKPFFRNMKEAHMPRGSKASYSDKQKRQAHHIEDSERKQGRSGKSAERIAWATVNKQDGGAKKKA